MNPPSETPLPLESPVPTNTSRKNFAGFGIVSALLLIVMVSLIKFTTNQSSRTTDIRSKANEDTLSLTVQPSSTTMPPDGNVDIILDAKTYYVGLVNIRLAFDKSKINLATDIVVSDKFQTVTTKSTPDQANADGKISIDLTYDPNASGNPATPSGVITIAKLKFKTVTSSATSTYLDFANDTQLSTFGNADTTLSVTAESGAFILNPTASVTPEASITPTGSPSPTAEDEIDATDTPEPNYNQADANQDGKVDKADFLIWRKYFNYYADGSEYGDFNQDGTVDGLDYAVWLKNKTR
jgi:hypothetical protein